jgi:predicted DNA-binding protein
LRGKGYGHTIVSRPGGRSFFSKKEEPKMYSPKISQEMVEKLYCLREELAKKGIKKPITILVGEAIEEYLKKREETQTENISG